jgi:hypothetical protein
LLGVVARNKGSSWTSRPPHVREEEGATVPVQVEDEEGVVASAPSSLRESDNK